MRIDTKDTICGIPILKVRDALKGPQGYFSTFEHLTKDLDISEKELKKLIKELKNRGYIQKYEDIRLKRKEYDNHLELTLEGVAFTMASAAPPIQRKTADKKVAELLERIKEMDSKEHAYRVSIALIFGSYLDKDKETVNDIDIAYELVPKKDYKKKAEECRERAELKGKCFNSWEERLFWPGREARKFLKKRSRMYSMHSIDSVTGLIEDGRDVTVKILYAIPELSEITEDLIYKDPSKFTDIVWGVRSKKK